MKFIEWFTIIVIMLLALYPCAELTRCILKYNPTGTRNMLSLHDGDYLELALFWGMFVCIPVILERTFNLFLKAGKK